MKSEPWYRDSVTVDHDKKERPVCESCNSYVLPEEPVAVGKIVFYNETAFRVVSMNGKTPVMREVQYCDRCGKKITKGRIHGDALRGIINKVNDMNKEGDK